MFRLNQTIIRKPTVCAPLMLQYWRQLKYFVVELFGRVAACESSIVGLCNVHSAECDSLHWHMNPVLLVCVLCTVQNVTLCTGI
jgi:hypothetical protein